jgi:peptide/nickel transport system permease protein
MQAFFGDPDAPDSNALRGRYQLQMNTLMFEEKADIDARLVLYGQVYGLAGTDDHRRDLMVGLLWGTPVALAFGLLAALGISFATMLIAAFSTWYGGWVDRGIQWITEMNMVLPAFPILLLVFNYYSMRLWTILAVTILLSIFGASVKTYRAIFLQVKQAPYVEAARAYGAGNLRIIRLYLVPRIISVLIPQLILLVPTYVFLETTLAYLGMSDPLLPTWGKIIRDALSSGGLTGDYYWLLAPFIMLLIVAFAFLALGYSMERVFDPRLRVR